ncbi:hypothetical protein [Nocardiopsis sp. MG754419]|uniref:hypothetical protein n=1 Tax=Nocardiopsis sp. MG754419 TaxID=2259865 RepID=UPI0020136004|nr:hypothetical protein [Nocardiopsis sp. MG754419]
MPSRVSAAPGTAILLALCLTGCASPQDTLAGGADASVVPTIPEHPFEEVDREDPFAGSPAEGFGTEFVVPEATEVSSCTSAQVAEAYDRTREFLEVTYLDQDAVLGEDDSAFVALLEGQALDW